MKSQYRKNKVLVALSGGVDSAVSAALLKKQGYEVMGVFLRLSAGKSADRSLIQAQKIAKKLKIPLKIVDARKDFKKKIIDYFISSYKKGITPNPCMVCNKEIKFRILFDVLKKEKADFVATGHYARIVHVTRSTKHVTRNIKKLHVTCYMLREALDKAKDQSYFLYRLSQKELAKIIFPLGEYFKSDVKKMAKKMHLPVAENESQDICFVPDNDMGSYLQKHIKLKSGNIIDERGNMLGKHRGLPLYTLGQRRGIEIGGTGPYFVIAKNAAKNQLIVSNNPKELLTKEFDVYGVNWINEEKERLKFPLRARVQIRYHAEKIPAIIRTMRSGRYEVCSSQFFRAVTPGQSAVFYKNNLVLGGGVIV